MSDFSRLNNGSNPQAVENNNDYDGVGAVKRSVFDLSRLYSTTVDMGALVPIDCFKVVPGDSLKLSNDLLVTVSNPLVKRMLASATIITHTYYSRCNDLWKGWNNYLTRGRAGSIAKTLPCVSLTLKRNTTDFSSSSNWQYVNVAREGATQTWMTPMTPMGLPAYLGVPFQFWRAPSSSYSYTDPDYGVSTNDQNYRSFYTMAEERGSDIVRRYTSEPKINALPFVMYQRIYRDYYLNKNLTQNNRMWFPADEDDFILGYNVTKAAYVSQAVDSSASVPTSPWTARSPVLNSAGIEEESDYPTLPFLRYRQWRGDDFTTGLPWQQRGEMINLFGDEELSKLYATMADADGSAATLLDGITPANPGDANAISTNGNTTWQNLHVSRTNSSTGLHMKQLYTDFSNLSLTANRIRELFVLSTWQERAARTNGDYNERVQAEFGRNPHWRDRTPIYIGGTRQRLVFSEVLQTSEDGNTPLGEQAGRAVSAASGDVGTYTVPDYGYVMTILSIVPDVTYSQGVPKWLQGATTFADEYFPIFNNLSPEPILNQELYYTGDTAYDEDIFAWRERFSYMKTRQNIVTGLLALNVSEQSDWAAYTFARYFTATSKPALNNNFVTMTPPTIRRDMFSVPSNPMFIIQCAERVRAVRPLPYRSAPANLSGYAM